MPPSDPEGLGIIDAVPPAPFHTVRAVLPHTAFPRAVGETRSALPRRWRITRAVGGPDRGSDEPPQVGDRSPSSPLTLGTPPPHPATGALLGPVMLSVPVIAPTACADFRSAPGRFAGCAYRPRLLPGAAGWQARGRLMPVRRRISPVPHSAVQTFRSPCAGGFLGAAYPSSSPRPWPSPLSQRLGSPLFPWVSRTCLRRCRIHLTLRTACLLDPRGAFVVALRRRGSLLAPATSYAAAWSLPWPDSHRRVECSFQDAREREGFMCGTSPAVSKRRGAPGNPVSAGTDVRRPR
jgi:hypothetical protein